MKAEIEFEPVKGLRKFWLYVNGVLIGEVSPSDKDNIENLREMR